jgi:hypothetical protein
MMTTAASNKASLYPLCPVVEGGGDVLSLMARRGRRGEEAAQRLLLYTEVGEWSD